MNNNEKNLLKTVSLIKMNPPAIKTLKTRESRHPRNGSETPPKRPTPTIRPSHGQRPHGPPEVQSRLQRVHRRSHQLHKRNGRSRRGPQAKDQEPPAENHKQRGAHRPIQHHGRSGPTLPGQLPLHPHLTQTGRSGRPEQQPQDPNPPRVAAYSQSTTLWGVCFLGTQFQPVTFLQCWL